MKIRWPFSIRIRAVGIYFFAILIAYLAAAYLGGFFIVLITVLILLPFVSILALFLSASGLRHNQQFSTDHPMKGEDVQYRYLMENNGFLPLPNVRVDFKSINPQLNVLLPEMVLYMPGMSNIEREYTIRLPYRGIYTVGVDRIELTDLMQLLTIRPRVSYRTFSVYPRVLPISRFTPGDEQRIGTAEKGARGDVPDYSLFNQLREYRSGESIRHMAWKKYASTGRPVLREYDSTAEPAVHIYLDLRAVSARAVDHLLAEDVSVEITIALVNHFLEQHVPVDVQAATPERLYSFRGFNPSQFRALYESNFELVFHPSVSPVRLYTTDQEAGTLNTKSVLFITHRADTELFSLLEEAGGSNFMVTVIFNATATPPEARAGLEDYFNRARDRGGNVVVVKSADSIIHDLEGIPYGTARSA